MKCQEQFTVKTDRELVIPLDAEGDLEVIINKDLTVTRNRIIVGDNISIKKNSFVFVSCNKELKITIGDGINQRYDEVVECCKSTGGCGFKKSSGDEKWKAGHCEYCGSELSDRTKIMKYNKTLEDKRYKTEVPDLVCDVCKKQKLTTLICISPFSVEGGN